MNTTLLVLKTRTRILLTCLFIMACGNAYSTIVSSGFYIGIYDNKRVHVIPINSASNYKEFSCVFFWDSSASKYYTYNSSIYINGKKYQHDRGGSVIQGHITPYYYSTSYLKEGVNVIENSNKSEQEYLIYKGIYNMADPTCITNKEVYICLSMGTVSIAYWERSYDGGLNWEKIDCTAPFYTTKETKECSVMYRCISSKGKYSSIRTIKYVNPMPEAIKTTIDNPTKIVDEEAVFSLDTPDHDYTYQWRKNDTDIDGANESSYRIDKVKAKDAGAYTCCVSNGAMTVVSSPLTLSVNKCPQAIDFPEFEPVTYGCEPLTLPEKTDKGLLLSYQSTNTKVATVDGNVLAVVGPGETNVIASHPGNDDYLNVSVTRILRVNKIQQTIDFGEIPTKTFGDLPFSLPKTSSAGLALQYKSINPEVATVSGNKVTIKGAGKTDIVASQDGDATHYAATPVTRTLTVNKAAQVITFDHIKEQVYAENSMPIPLRQETDKGLPVSYIVEDESIASVDGYNLNILKPGTTTITASQVGDKNYLPAKSVSQTLTVDKGQQRILIDHIESQAYASPDFELKKNSDKGLPITYTSDNENVATIRGNTVHITGAGTCNITATQAGNEYYNAAASVTLPFTVTKAYQEITFKPINEATYGDAPVKLSASSSSDLDIYFESSDESVAKIDGSNAIIVGAGTCYITARTVSSPNYFDASPVNNELTVNKANQSIIMGDLPVMTYGDAPFELSAQATSGETVTFTSSDPDVVFISGNTAKIMGAGTAWITATQQGGDNYNKATRTKSIRINKANLLAIADNKTRFYGDNDPVLTISYTGFVNGDSKADLDVKLYAKTHARINSQVGDYDIEVMQEENGNDEDRNYKITYRKGTLSIEKAPLAITANDKTRAYGDANPKFTFAYDGLKLGETASTALWTMPMAMTDAKAASPVGEYPIYVSGAEAMNYDIRYEQGTLTVEKAILDVYVQDAERDYGQPNPDFIMVYEGLKNGETESDLESQPIAICGADENSATGTYPIILSGGSDPRYSFNLHDGVLTILEGTSIENVNAVDVSIWSRNGEILVQSKEPLTNIDIFDISGKQIAGERDIRKNELRINAGAGIYIVKYWTKTGSGMKKIAVR